MPKYAFEIPDSAHTVPDDRVASMGPSAPLIPFVPEPLQIGGVLGRPIGERTPNAGTYGMGGPGFLGFCLGDDWLIIAIWGASNWFRLDGRLLDDPFWERHGRDRPWLDDPDVDGDAIFRGWNITSLDVHRDSIRVELGGRHVLLLAPDPADRPVYEGDGSARMVDEDDDLRSAVFIAPTAELWI